MMSDEFWPSQRRIELLSIAQLQSLTGLDEACRRAQRGRDGILLSSLIPPPILRLSAWQVPSFWNPWEPLEFWMRGQVEDWIQEQLSSP